MSSKRTQKRKSTEEVIDSEQKQSRKSSRATAKQADDHVLVATAGRAEDSTTISSGATAKQADDHVLVATAGRAEDSTTTSSGATAKQADDHVLVATAGRAEDSTTISSGATAKQADDHILVATAGRAEESTTTSSGATAKQADDHVLVATAGRAEDSTTTSSGATAKQADDHVLVATAGRAEDSTTTSSGATAEQADDHVLVATAGRAEDSTTTSSEATDDPSSTSAPLSRTQIWNLIRQGKSRTDKVNLKFISERLPSILTALGSSVKQGLDTDDKNIFCKHLHKFYLKYEERWLEGSRKIKLKDQEWAESAFIVPLNLVPVTDDSADVNPSESPVVDLDLQDPASPSTSFSDLPRRTQYAHIQKMKEKISGEPITKILRAVASEVKDQSAKSMPPEAAKATAYVLKKMARSPSKPQKIAEVVKNAEKEKTPIPFTPQEALAVIIDHGVTRETYTWLQRDLSRRNFKAFPSYKKVQSEKKMCHPEEAVEVNEYRASVPLQSLLEHTTKRIVEIQEPDDDQKVISNFMSSKGINELTCILYVSWGFDGSSCQSRYKQKFADSEESARDDDQNMLATTIIPLRLVSDLCKNTPFWENSTPQSVRYCRPLRLQFLKETPEVIMNEYNGVQREIQELKPYTVILKNGFKVHVNYHMYLTLIDGKVLSHITHTSSYQVCPLCKATPKDLNDLAKMRSKTVVPENLQYGLSPLHAWIRVLEFLLHLGYKNEPGLQKAVLRQTPQIKKQLETRKKKIQAAFRSETGLLVDQPKAGGCGSTNDGNTARTALSIKYRAKVAQILDLELWLLEDFHTILSVLSCGLEIDPTKFGNFCDTLADKFVSKYGWYRMPVTIHKILIHGKEVIESLALPVGMLSEQAAESRHRLFRLFRTKHAYQGDRETALREIFHRSLEASDPAISEFRLYERQKQLKRQPLSTAAINLLRPVAVIASDVEDIDFDPSADDMMEFRNELMGESSIALSDEEVEASEEELDA